MKNKENPMRKQKEIKILHCYVYTSITYLEHMHIQVMDRKTGKVYAGNISKTYDKLKDWKNRK